jgi:hypothetical protein
MSSVTGKERNAIIDRSTHGLLTHTTTKPVVTVVMGVSGSGKPTLQYCSRPRSAASSRKATICIRLPKNAPTVFC